MGDHMNRFGIGWVAALALASFTACGGNTAHHSSDTGSGGTAPNAGGSGGTDAGSGGGSGTAGVICKPDARVPDDVVEATERCLDPSLVVTDLDLLDGKSFVLPEGLCPKQAPNDDWYSDEGDYSGGGSSLRTLHLKRQGDDLELVSSVPTETEPTVQRTKLIPLSSGFGATSVLVCAHTVNHYEDDEIVSYEAPLVQLAFVPGADPETLDVVFGARIDVDHETVVLTGTPDREPPSIRALKVYSEHLQGLDRGYDPEQPGAVEPPYFFFFSEPVLAEELSIDDGLGKRVRLDRSESEGTLVGFDVRALVLGEPTFDFDVTDLAGNAFEPGPSYPGITLGTTTGDIESYEDYITPSKSWLCGAHGLYSEKGGEEPVPPLAGTNSLSLIACTGYFRVSRSPGANELAFEVRTGEPTTRLDVEVRAIGANGSTTSLTIAPRRDGAEWVMDPDYSTEQAFVSLPTKVSLPLPAEGDDLIVLIESFGKVWLDSIVTE